MGEKSEGDGVMKQQLLAMLLQMQHGAHAGPATPAAAVSQPNQRPAIDGRAAAQQAVAAVLGAEVDPGAPLMDAGLDSLGAGELRNALQQAVGDALGVPAAGGCE